MSASEQVDVSGFVEEAQQPSVARTVGPSVQPRTLTDIQAANEGTPSAVPDEFLTAEPDYDPSVDFAEMGFWEDFERRVSNGQDLLILVSDYENDRGTGKTTLSCDLADRMDRSQAGLIPAKASIAPEELINAYTEQEQGSALILDEAEAGVGSRDAMTNVNKLMNKIVSMARVMEKYVIMNMPASNHIDKGILDLAHYWILVRRKGLCRVYDLRNNPFEQKKYPVPVQDLQWDPITSDRGTVYDTYKSLTEEKQTRLGNGNQGDGMGYMTGEDVAELLEKEKKEALNEQRDDIVERMLTHPRIQEAGIPQSVMADLVDMSQSHISNVKESRGL
ncbi:hypothetical protein [Halomarina oriensis]|uniref:Uncharacterized protein n=1 Tax=Halomarina oriensis TaxID=671145 RepID=A0A6B0GDU5_9EURY|nr:hypothetical protein [Halomarina oriensis]MWG33106.1 hypothetical protein [Halomarina oriensis]